MDLESPSAMLTGFPLDDAEQVLRAKVAESQNESTVFLNTLEGFKQFVQTQFQVPDSPDSDGCLIEYGVSKNPAGPEFYLHLVRQFEQLDEDGEHEQYFQTCCDLSFALDDELKALGYQAQWWFRNSDSDGDSFDQWWIEQTSSAWMQLLSQRVPKAVEIWQDTV